MMHVKRRWNLVWNTCGWTTGARSEESADFLGDRIQVDVVETGSGRQAGHGAHLRETPQNNFI